MKFREYLQTKGILSEDKYVDDTKKHIDDVLKTVDKEDAKEFLQGLKDFLDKEGYLTPDQRKGLAAFNKEAPEIK
jgi:hypothetical protein